ncbi:MAG: TM0106 family RecB-like putative nuclease [Planctomycetes bacterium]|nr:TM0106 family RecB-like putative nuclease [Planctomycetota bacterium]
MPRKLRPITGTHLFQRERCSRWVWLDFHEDPARKLPPDAAAAARMAQGRRHEREIVAKLDVVEPHYPANDFEAGERATRELMGSGAPLIYQGVLLGEHRVGKPDLLRRADGGGTPRYLLGDIKASSRAKLEHAMQLAFYADLLAASQSDGPKTAFLLLGDGREERVQLDDVEPFYREAAAEVEAMRERRHEPRAAFHVHCHGCAWRGVCLPELEARGDLSLVHGISPARREALEEVGVHNIAQLACIEPAQLAARTELPRETLRRLRLQARALLDRAPHRLAPLPWKAARIAVAAEFARHPIRGHVAEFLAYRTIAAGNGFQEQWIHESAQNPEEEGPAYRRFLSSLSLDRDAPIYHFGAELPDTLAQLDARHGKLNDPLPQVFARLHDVQVGIRSSLVLPILRYDLDRVAQALLGTAPESVEPHSAETDDQSPQIRRALAERILLVRRVRLAAARAWQSDGAASSAVSVSPEGTVASAPAAAGLQDSP